jgi:tol-pal system protein YbgF
MRLRLPAVATAGLLAAACAASPPWVSLDDHQRQERQLLELQRRYAQAEVEIERLQQRLAELEGGTTPPATPAPVVAPAAAPSEAPLPGWRARPATIEESELAEIASTSDPATLAAASGYERGLALLRDGRPAEAETVLLAFAEASASSDLADNAWFWVGESRLVRGDTAGAIAAYRSCLELHPEGNKVPDAMLKLGHALATSGDPASADEVWAELVRRFPSTAAAESARSRLATP